MRVAVIASYAGSFLTFRRALLQEMVERGHEVTACAPDFDEHQRRRLAELGARAHPVSLARAGTNPLQDLAFLWRLTRALRAVKPDLVFAYTVKPVIYGLLAARFAGVPRRFGMLTGLGYAFGDAGRGRRLLSHLVSGLCKAAFAASDRILVQNPDDGALLVERGLLPAAKLVTVNGSGVPLDEFEATPPPPGPPVFLLIARLLVEKGVLDFVEAARRLKPRHPEARFQILGPFDDNPSSIQPDQLRGWIQEGLVEHLGETRDVKPYIRSAHVFVLPSFYREGTPRSALEAMAMGRAIVTTDAPGCRETVIEGGNGFLVPPRDGARLAKALARFIDEPALIERAGRASRQLAEEKYDVHKVNQVMLSAMGLSAEGTPPRDRPAPSTAPGRLETADS